MPKVDADEIDSQLKRYGRVPWEGAVDVAQAECTSWDLRAITGAQGVPDESCTYAPGTHPFTRSVHAPAGFTPTAEIRFMMPHASGLREVRLVGALTGREGVVEVTPSHLSAAMADPDGYLQTMRQWLGLIA